MQTMGGGGQTKRPSGTKDVNGFGFPFLRSSSHPRKPRYASRGQGPRRKEPSITAVRTLLHQQCAFSPGSHQRPSPAGPEMHRVGGYWCDAAAMTLLSGGKVCCNSLPCRLFWYPIAGLSCEADPGSRKPVRWTPPGPVNLFPCLPAPQRDALKQYANRQWPSRQCA